MAIAAMVVTQSHIDAAIKAGACRTPELGTRIASIPQEDLIWYTDHVSRETINGVPLWALSDSGHGHGYGYGYGYGDGFGHGFGHGYGYGDGYGYGVGYGAGYGVGYGVGVG